MRNDHGSVFKGITKKKAVNHTFWEGAATLGILFLILSAVSYQENNIDDSVSMRLGGGDSTYDILMPLQHGEEITSEITNLHPTLVLQFTIIWVDDSVSFMDQGVIDWDKLTENRTVYEVSPGASKNVTIDDPKIWHLIILLSLIHI